MSAATDNIGIAIRAMKQKAMYWAPLELDDYGKPTFDQPIEIDCRWEDKVEEFILPNGDRAISRARLIVDRDLDVKGLMKLSSYDLKLEEDPWDNNDVWEIRAFMKTPDLRGTKYLREVLL